MHDGRLETGGHFVADNQAMAVMRLAFQTEHRGRRESRPVPQLGEVILPDCEQMLAIGGVKSLGRERPCFPWIPNRLRGAQLDKMPVLDTRFDQSIAQLILPKPRLARDGRIPDIGDLRDPVRCQGVDKRPPRVSRVSDGVEG